MLSAKKVMCARAENPGGICWEGESGRRSPAAGRCVSEESVRSRSHWVTASWPPANVPPEPCWNPAGTPPSTRPVSTEHRASSPSQTPTRPPHSKQQLLVAGGLLRSGGVHVGGLFTEALGPLLKGSPGDKRSPSGQSLSSKWTKKEQLCNRLIRKSGGIFCLLSSSGSHPGKNRD
ncbi:hypothetical protein GN956_G21562 [Arapaima gigas]